MIFTDARHAYHARDEMQVDVDMVTETEHTIRISLPLILKSEITR